MRFTKTRAVVGALSSVSHWASVSRVGGASVARELRAAGTPAITGFAGFSQSPRFNKDVILGSLRAVSVSEVAPAGHRDVAAAICAFLSAQAGTVVRQ